MTRFYKINGVWKESTSIRAMSNPSDYLFKKIDPDIPKELLEE